MFKDLYQVCEVHKASFNLERGQGAQSRHIKVISYRDPTVSLKLLAVKGLVTRSKLVQERLALTDPAY